MSERAHDEHLVKKRARAIFATWMGVGIFIIWMLISSALDMYSAWESHNAREQLVDCVIPDGKCAQHNAKTTEAALNQIFEDGITRERITRQIIILSDWCSDQPDVKTLDEREQCVNEQLALKEKERDNE